MKIHDGLTQSVTSAILELQSLRTRIAADPATATSDLKVIEDEIRKDLADIRHVLFALQNGDAFTGPLADDPTLGTFIGDVVRRWGLHVRVSVEGDMRGVSREVLETAHGMGYAVKEGFPDADVLEAEGGKAALEIMQSKKIDIALVDVRMPELDGLELLRQMRANWPDMPVIMLSTYENAPYVKRALAD